MPFKAARCPNCNGDLQVPEEKDVVICMYCGTNIIVREAINIAIKNGPSVESLMKLASDAQNAYNFEEAYFYYNKVLELEIINPEAWLGKAACAGILSTLNNFRYTEMKIGIENALNYSSNSEEIKLKISKMLNNVCIANVDNWIESVKNYNSHKTMKKISNNILEVINLLEIAANLNSDSTLFKNITQYIDTIFTMTKTPFYDRDDLNGWLEPTKKYFNIDYNILDSLKLKKQHYTQLLDPTVVEDSTNKKSFFTKLFGN